MPKCSSVIQKTEGYRNSYLRASDSAIQSDLGAWSIARYHFAFFNTFFPKSCLIFLSFQLFRVYSDVAHKNIWENILKKIGKK